MCFTSFTVSSPENPDSARETPISCLSVSGNSLLSCSKTLMLPSSARQSPRINLIAVLFPAPFFPINPSICPYGSSIDILNVKLPYVFRTFCITIIQFPPFFFMFCCLTFYINLKQIPHQAFHDCVISISKVSYRFYFSSRISFTTSDISFFFIPMESARSITLSKSSSIAFCLASNASCLSEADT